MLLSAVLLHASPLCSAVLCLWVGRLHGWVYVLLPDPLPWYGLRCWPLTPRHRQVCCVGCGPAGMVGRSVLLRGRPHGGASCARAWPASMAGRAVLVFDPPPWRGVLCWCLTRHHGRACCVVAGPAVKVGRAVLVHGAPPRSGVLCWCLSSLVGRAVLFCGLPHGGAGCVGAWPGSCSGMMCSCVARLMVGRALVVRARPPGCT